MNESYVAKIASELKIQGRQVAATAKLIAEGACGFGKVAATVLSILRRRP